RQAAELDRRAEQFGPDEGKSATVAEYLVMCLGVAGQIQDRCALFRRMKGNLLGHDRLTGTRGANDHRQRPADESAAQDEVQVGDPRLQYVRCFVAAARHPSFSPGGLWRPEVRSGQSAT